MLHNRCLLTTIADYNPVNVIDNILFMLNRTAHSSKTLLRLVRFNVNKKLLVLIYKDMLSLVFHFKDVLQHFKFVNWRNGEFVFDVHAITILMNPLFFRHVIIDKKVLASAITDGGTEETFGKEIITTKKTGEVIEIEFGGKTAKVVTKDVDAKNGVVHEIASIIGV